MHFSKNLLPLNRVHGGPYSPRPPVRLLTHRVLARLLPTEVRVALMFSAAYRQDLRMHRVGVDTRRLRLHLFVVFSEYLDDAVITLIIQLFSSLII